MNNEPDYQCDCKFVKNKQNLKKCLLCKKNLSKKNFKRHRDLCANKNMMHPLKVDSVPVSLITTLKDHDDLPPAFAKHILHKLRNDTIGDLCCREKVLIRLGVIFYSRIKCKKDKKTQGNKLL